jgi:hypothetical protein
MCLGVHLNLVTCFGTFSFLLMYGDYYKKVLSNHNVYISDVFGSLFYKSDMIWIALYFGNVCGLSKQMSKIFEALIVSDVNKTAISGIMMLSNCNYSL